MYHLIRISRFKISLYGIFRPREGAARAGVAIGDLILDLSVLEERGFFSDVAAAAVRQRQKQK